jgi:hypothetical protein
MSYPKDMKQKTKSVTILWTELHHYEAKIEIPENLSHEEEIDWIILNMDTCGMKPREPWGMNTDWDSIHISATPYSKRRRGEFVSEIFVLPHHPTPKPLDS